MSGFGNSGEMKTFSSQNTFSDRLRNLRIQQFLRGPLASMIVVVVLTVSTFVMANRTNIKSPIFDVSFGKEIQQQQSFTKDTSAVVAPYPGAPLCPNHDDTIVHGLWNSQLGCHYDHLHGDAEALPEPDIFFCGGRQCSGSSPGAMPSGWIRQNN